MGRDTSVIGAGEYVTDPFEKLFYETPPNEAEDFSSRFRNVSTSDEVAEILRTAGIKGKRYELNACPLANLALHDIPGVDVEVDDEGLAIEVRATGMAFRHNTTPAMKDFIRRFDLGEFPDLIEEET